MQEFTPEILAELEWREAEMHKRFLINRALVFGTISDAIVQEMQELGIDTEQVKLAQQKENLEDVLNLTSEQQ